MLMAKTVPFSFRFNEETQRELESLTAEASSRNAAVVEAIHQAYRGYAYERMRRESQALSNDPEYHAEVEAIREAMGTGDAW
jgi:tRNA(Arg) A34 adenosine deaminase TadA